jgi:hypothetical protein
MAFYDVVSANQRQQTLPECSAPELFHKTEVAELHRVQGHAAELYKVVKPALATAPTAAAAAAAGGGGSAAVRACLPVGPGIHCSPRQSSNAL